ncbi:MAG: hypothetical protein E3J43_01125, partial [Candidatus Heimdallarchaeota archaeon]
MSTQESNLFQPCNPDDFYGLRDIIKDFNQIKEDMKKEGKKTHSVLLVGDEGTGKSSLLRKLSSSISVRKDISHMFDLVPEEEELLEFFKEWKNMIDEISPAWRSVLEKVGKRKLGDDLPALKENIKKQTSQTYTEIYVNLFFENLDKVNQKLQETQTTLYFFVDNIHLFKLMDIQEFYPIFSTIIKELSIRGYNIVVITALTKQYLVDFDYEKNLTDNSKIFSIEPLSVSDTEIYLRRIAPQLVNKGILELVNNSQRTFFDLNLGNFFIKSGFGIDDFVERNIPKVFGLTDEEESVLSEMASFNENLFLIEQLTAYVPLEALKSLEEKGFLWIGSTHARLVQESLLTAMKFRMRLFSPLTSLMVTLDSILEDLSKYISPTDKIIEKVGNLSVKVRDRLADFAVASKIQKIANICIERKMYQKAYDLTLINTQQFEQINELEQAGSFCEKIAREFEEKNFYFAARLYLKSAAYYKAVEEELKANRSYARAADQFEKLSVTLPVEKSEYAIRGYLKSSLDCYKNMGDKTN